LNNLSCVTLQFKTGATIPEAVKIKDEDVSIPAMIISESTEAYWIAAYSNTKFTFPRDWDDFPEIFAIERSQVNSIVVHKKDGGKPHLPSTITIRASDSAAMPCAPEPREPGVLEFLNVQINRAPSRPPRVLVPRSPFVYVTPGPTTVALSPGDDAAATLVSRASPEIRRIRTILT
jgi:hypothetical protein